MTGLTHLTECDLEKFDQKGYLVFENIFDFDYAKRLMETIDLVERDRFQGHIKRLIEYPALGLLTSEPIIVGRVADLMQGSKFSMRYLHAKKMSVGEPASWHHDYTQIPQTNRSHLMVHVFIYPNGLNGEIADLMVLPGSHKRVMAVDAFAELGYERLPNSIVFDDLGKGSVIFTHSALLHSRRPRPSGSESCRYFIDIPYCQHGILWPNYRKIDEIHKIALEKGWDRNGEYAFLYETEHFYNRIMVDARLAEVNIGSLGLQL